MTRIARCCCGSLRAEASDEPALVAACHCMECQRRTGSPFGVGTYFRKEQVRTEGSSKVTESRSCVFPVPRKHKAAGRTSGLGAMRNSRNRTRPAQGVNMRSHSIAARVWAAHERFWMLPPIIVGLAIVTAGVGTGHLVLPPGPTLW
jgi:hypothetical protein